MRRLEHLHQEGVDGRVSDQFKEEQVLQALQTDGAQCWEPQEELRKPTERNRDINIETLNNLCEFPIP